MYFFVFILKSKLICLKIMKFNIADKICLVNWNKFGKEVIKYNKLKIQIL